MEKRLTNHNFFILDSMDDWVRIISPDGKVIFENQRMKDDTKNVKFLENLVNNYDPKNEIEQTSHIMKNTTIVEEKLIDGKYYSIKTSPVYFDDEFLGIVEVYRDITSESKMKIDLFNANRDMLDDIRFVKKIQNNILPKNKSYGKIRLEGKYVPSNDLSGDMFDIIKINDNKYAFYMADVMGHGVKASMMTMFVKVSLSAIFERHPFYSPKQALLKIRQKFVDLEMTSSQYFTIWLGIFDLKNESLTFANAGHNCPPLLKANGKEKLQTLEVSGRMISNIIEPTDYHEVKVDFKPKDKILFYTDGLTESQNMNKIDYGIERLREKFQQTSDLSSIVKDVEEYTWGEQKDDIALALIVYKEKSQREKM
ncbi:MAG: SpoIIE family protein phosphatase [Anaerococcus sp.]|nr:SpoIIE family protein phosphatase [Anaerococcus sp.]